MSQPHLALPETYVGAEHVFGPSSFVRGEKSSFCFPSVLSMETDAGPVRYVIYLQDMKGTIELPFFRQGDGESPGIPAQPSHSRSGY